jgi:hypothetical protein
MSSENQAALEQEYARFNGVWAFELVEVEGKQQPEAPFPANKMIVAAADRRFVVIQGAKITRGVFHLDPYEDSEANRGHRHRRGREKLFHPVDLRTGGRHLQGVRVV